jgi:hypothetical protein
MNRTTTNLKFFLRKIGELTPTVEINLTYESYRIALGDLGERQSRVEAAANENARLLQLIRNERDKIISLHKNNTKTTSLTCDSSEQIYPTNHSGNLISYLIDKLNDPNIISEERSIIISEIKHHFDNQTRSIEDAKNSLQKIIDALKIMVKIVAISSAHNRFEQI